MPRWTLRLRLTILYGSLFLVAGAVLLAITYGLVAHSAAQTRSAGVVVSRDVVGGPRVELPQPLPPPTTAPNKSFQLQAYAGKVTATFRKVTAAQRVQLHRLATKATAQIDQQRSSQLSALLTRSGIALVIMAFVSIGLGWLVAGRALRPVRTMSARARGISERNLHARLALEGPDDELKELGDTFDGLLARLESAFESQRQFVANASHELRTPITLERTLVEVALADPGATLESLRGTCNRVLAAGEQQERLIEALLTLARSQRGLAARREVDLGEIAGEALAALEPADVRVEAELGEARTWGDPALIERLVGNLLDNALRHNVLRRGWISVWTGVDAGRPTLRIANTGPLIRPEEAGALTEPFRRLNGNRTDTRGAGLGLSIVAAIAAAHGAELRPTPRPEGGLDVEVRFPQVAAGSETRELEHSGIPRPRNLLS